METQITTVPEELVREIEKQSSSIKLPSVEHQPNRVSIFEFVLSTELYGVVTLKALMGRRPEPEITPNMTMIPNAVMAGSICLHIDNAKRLLYMHHYAPLSEILSDIDPQVAIEALAEQLTDAASENSVSYRLIRDTTREEDRRGINERMLRESAAAMAAAIRKRLELAPPLPTSGVEGDDFETISRTFDNPPLTENPPDEHVYDEIHTEIQEAIQAEGNGSQS